MMLRSPKIEHFGLRFTHILLFSLLKRARTFAKNYVAIKTGIEKGCTIDFWGNDGQDVKTDLPKTLTEVSRRPRKKRRLPLFLALHNLITLIKTNAFKSTIPQHHVSKVYGSTFGCHCRHDKRQQPQSNGQNSTAHVSRFSRASGYSSLGSNGRKCGKSC